MRVLVSAASKHGATSEIAGAIADVLTERGIDAVALPPDEVVTVDGFDAAIIGSGVYAGRWLASANRLIDRNRESLAAVPVWLFSSGPIGDPPHPDGEAVDVARLEARIGARDHRVFAGRLLTRDLGFAERAIVMAVRAAEGDFRSWDEIRNWAAQIAQELQPAPEVSRQRFVTAGSPSAFTALGGPVDV